MARMVSWNRSRFPFGEAITDRLYRSRGYERVVQTTRFVIFSEYRYRGETAISKELRVNEEIRVREVRVVGNDGEQLGILPIRDALRVALERQMDLVEVAPAAKPPVCKIMDYGRFKYEQSKKDREARKKQKIIELKEMQLRPNIEDHDFETKSNHVIRFLNEGDKVRVTIRFRGREMAHTDLGRVLLDRMAKDLAEICVVEREPRQEGKNLFMILAPKAT